MKQLVKNRHTQIWYICNTLVRGGNEIQRGATTHDVAEMVNVIKIKTD